MWVAEVAERGVIYIRDSTVVTMPTFGGTTSVLAHDDALKDDFTPDGLPEREQELEDIHYVLEPASRGYTPHNAFIYGPSGQGKTVATKIKLDELEGFIHDSAEVDVPFRTFYVNCADLKSSYQVAGEVLKEISPEWDERPRGYGLSNLFDWIFERMNELGGIIVIVLDEIDVIGDDDTILYKLSRARANDEVTDDVRPSVIGISNDFDFHDNLSQRVKDTLCEEEVRFAPYDANQLRAILERRAEKAFKPGVLEDDVIPLCAAYGAQSTGSAREALRLLYKAGTLAQRDAVERVTEEHVRKGREKIEKETVREGAKDLTDQETAALLSVTLLEVEGETPARTKEIYQEYKQIAVHVNLDVSTTRSFRDQLQALDLYSFLDGAKKTGGMEGGKRWVFELGQKLDVEMVVEVMESNTRFEAVIGEVCEKTDLNLY